MKEKKVESLAYNERSYSYEDLLAFPEEKRVEIIDGKLFELSAPTLTHQEILGEIYRQIANFLENRKCKVFIAPIDVKIDGIRENKECHNVVQPDLLVVCDEKKITKQGIIGAPNFILEVLSPSNMSYDLITKLNLYMKYGVKEYWIVDPEKARVLPYILSKEGLYTIKRTYSFTEKMEIDTLNNFAISLAKFNTKELEDDENEEKKG